MHIAVSTAPGGATRFTAQLQNNTQFWGKVITPDPACLITDGAQMGIVLGVTYTGDQGLETAADRTTTPCIVQSKCVYSEFRFDEPELGLFEGIVKDNIHQAIDGAVINTLFGGPGKPVLPGRCARWRTMP
jgi:hypothetical protein